MKKLLLILSLTVIGLNGCYFRGHDEGYRRDRDHHEDNDHQRGHDDRRSDRDGDHDR